MQGWKRCLNAVAVCAIAVRKVWFLDGFTFPLIHGFGVLCVGSFRRLLVTLGPLLVSFEGIGSRFEI